MGCVRCHQLMTAWKRIVSKMHCENAARSAYKAVIEHRLECALYNDGQSTKDPLGIFNRRMIITSGFDSAQELSAQTPNRP